MASPETATDADYAAILGVIGHEVCFHWTALVIVFSVLSCTDYRAFCLSTSITGLVIGKLHFSLEWLFSSLQGLQGFPLLYGFWTSINILDVYPAAE